MAVETTLTDASLSITDNVSDYGSDLDDATALDVLSQVESQPMRDVVLESIEKPIPIEDDSLEGRLSLRLSQIQRSLDSVHKSQSRIESIVSERRVREASIEVEYDEKNRRSFSRTSSRTCYTW